jgi:hypothetical protein
MTGSEVRTDTVEGWTRVHLENEHVRASILPEKGADIYELVDSRSGVDALFKMPAGLRPAGLALDAERVPEPPFIASYEGGWQELFPSVRGPCLYEGKRVPFHGEVALRPWQWTVVRDGPDVAVVLEVSCDTAPLTLRRIMRLERDTSALILEETVMNDSPGPAAFVWGHHFVVGAPLLASGARLESSASRIVTDAEYPAAASRLPAESEFAWPVAVLSDGTELDVREVPGPEARTHDHYFLRDLSSGAVSVGNAELELSVTLSWDRAVFPWIRVWSAYGGAQEPPLDGIYALGLEPWSSNEDLARSLRSGSATGIAPGSARSTVVRAGFSRFRGARPTAGRL